MKILQINAVNGLRSTGRFCVEIADYLNANKHESYIAYSTGVPNKRGYRIGTPIDVKIHGLLSHIFGMQAYYSRSSTKMLLKYMEELKPDVVHLHNLHSNYINLELLLKYLAKKDIATVITLHDCWFYTGKCTHYTIDNCFKWINECGNCPRLKKDNKSWFFDQTTKMHRDKKQWFSKIHRLAVVGVSDWITTEASKSFLSSAKVITRIYNWVDLDVFRPVNVERLRKKLCLDSEFVILGVASEWSVDKGLDKFIELASSLPDDMIIILIGNLDNKVTLPYRLIHIKETHDLTELVGYYSIADVFLNFSREESFGKVTAEALACGTPVITNSLTANPELVGQGCGYIIDDFDCILDKINQIKRNGKDYYSKACVEFAWKHFDSTDRINDYLALYSKIIERPAIKCQHQISRSVEKKQLKK